MTEETNKIETSPRCTNRVRVISIVFLAILDVFCNASTLNWRGELEDPWSSGYTLGDSIYDLWFSSILRLLVIIISLPLVKMYHLSVFESFQYIDHAGNNYQPVNEKSSVLGESTVLGTTIQTPLISEEEVGGTSGDVGGWGSKEAVVGEVSYGGSSKGKKKESEPLKALNKYISSWATLLWCCAIVQCIFVSIKLLVRMAELCGSEQDGLYWLCVTSGSMCPILEVMLAVKVLSIESHNFALSKGWKEEEKKEEKNTNASIKDMLAYLVQDVHLIMFAMSGLTIAAAGESMIPYLYGQIIESVAVNGNMQKFHEFMLLLVVTAAITGVATGVRGSGFIVLGSRFSTRIREALFKKLLQLEIGFYDETKTGDVSSRISADCQKVGDQVELNVNVFLRSVIQAFLIIAVMYWLNWRLATLTFVIVPNVVIASKIFGTFMRELTKEVQKALADSTAASEEALGSMRTVKSLHAQEEMGKRYAFHMAEYRRLSLRCAAVYFPFSALTYTFLPYCASCLVLFYGGKLINKGKLQSGELVSFVFYMQSLFSTFSSLGNIYVGLVQAVGAADKVFEWVNRVPISTMPKEGDGLVPKNCSGEIRIENVDFTYPQRPERPILQNLSLTASSGQVLALCGESGGGKSSVMALIQNWYEPNSGDIYLDGIRTRDLNQCWFHRVVAMVAQEPVLYARTVYENIVMGLDITGSEPSLESLPKPTLAEVQDACKLANAHEFIMAMPDGYETEVGERGAMLSGGQRQRIAIARALVRKPKVLLLDEATSALDAESEFQVQTAIDGMMSRGDMTVIIIAHRLSTIRRADTIVVIGKGKVLEMGNHEELFEKDGHYAALASRQMGRPNPRASI